MKSGKSKIVVEISPEALVYWKQLSPGQRRKIIELLESVIMFEYIRENAWKKKHGLDGTK